MGDRKFKGRVALVTGASRGIGRTVALRLAGEGAAVAVNYRTSADGAQEVIRQIRSSGGQAIAIGADVSNKEAVRAMVDQIVVDLGPVDILVNNAGVLHTGELLNYDEGEFDRMWEINVKGVLHCTAAVAPSMIERNHGRVINLSSIAAVGTAFRGTTLYAATKGAVLTLTKRFAFELGPNGITVNAVLPGFTLTEMVAQGKSPEELQRIVENVSAKSMLRRTGVPEDIGHVISFLASDESSFMTGQYLVADGGRMDYLAHS